MNQYTKGWPSERVDLLKSLWTEGLSYTQIGGQLGVSRNSIASKVASLNLPKRRDEQRGKNMRASKAAKSGSGEKQKNRPIPFASGFTGLCNGSKKPPQFPKLSQQQKDFILGVPLEALADHRCGCAQCISLGPRIDPQKCKWPLDDPEPGKEFCGARQMEGLPYCEAHAAIAYQGGYQAAMRRQAAVIRDAVERLRRG